MKIQQCIAVIAFLECCSLRICEASCGGDVTQTSGNVEYDANQDEDCTWKFIPLPNEPNNILIIDFYYISSYNSKYDEIILPNGEQLTDDLSTNNESICRSYLITNDKTRNCKKQISNQYCQDDVSLIKNVTDQIPNLSSSHDRRSYDRNLYFSFNYEWVDCPLIPISQNLESTFEGIFYEIKNNDGDYTWLFIPPTAGPNNLLIINFFYVNSYNSNSDNITLPDGEEISRNLTPDNDPICRSYLLTDDDTRNCSNEFSKQYCKVNITDGVIIYPMVKSKHNKTSNDDGYLAFSFSYLFLECPQKLNTVSTKNPPVATTTNSSSDEVTTISEIDTTTHDVTTLAYNETSTNYSETSKISTTDVGNSQTNFATETSMQPPTNQLSNQNSLVYGVIALAVILGISWILFAIFITKFVHGKRSKKERKTSLSAQQSKLGDISDLSTEKRYDDFTPSKIYFGLASLQKEPNVEDSYSLAQQEHTKEMVDNDLYDSNAVDMEKETDIEDNYTLAHKETKEMVDNDLYDSNAVDVEKETDIEGNYTLAHKDIKEMVDNVLYDSGSFEPTLSATDKNTINEENVYHLPDQGLTNQYD